VDLVRLSVVQADRNLDLGRAELWVSSGVRSFATATRKEASSLNPLTPLHNAQRMKGPEGNSESPSERGKIRDRLSLHHAYGLVAGGLLAKRTARSSPGSASTERRSGATTYDQRPAASACSGGGAV
jgi:hypothetical protein